MALTDDAVQNFKFEIENISNRSFEESREQSQYIINLQAWTFIMAWQNLVLGWRNLSTSLILYPARVPFWSCDSTFVPLVWEERARDSDK